MAESWMAINECSEGYQMGFHSVPSMNHLHMHVISKVCNRIPWSGSAWARSIRCCFLVMPAHAHMVDLLLCCLPLLALPPQDFDSPKLRNKQHWNSFTTAFFVPLDKVLLDLEARDAVAVDPVQAEALLKQPLRCHKCQTAVRNMPDLKTHIVACMARISSQRG